MLADEASHKEQLCVCIRCIDENFNIYEAPLKLINVPKTDSETLGLLIEDCLVWFSLPLNQCRGQAYDSPSNMSGHIGGVAAQIQREEPTALYVHCLAHCTNLCLQTVGRAIAPVRDALELVMGVGQLIRFSPKQSYLFQSIDSQLTPGAPSLKPLCPTRWTVRTSALEALLANYKIILYDALALINSEGRDDYAVKTGLSKPIRKNIYIILSLNSHIYSFQQLNNFFSPFKALIPQFKKLFRHRKLH